MDQDAIDSADEQSYTAVPQVQITQQQIESIEQQIRNDEKQEATRQQGVKDAEVEEAHFEEEPREAEEDSPPAATSPSGGKPPPLLSFFPAASSSGGQLLPPEPISGGKPPPAGIAPKAAGQITAAIETVPPARTQEQEETTLSKAPPSYLQMTPAQSKNGRQLLPVPFQEKATSVPSRPDMRVTAPSYVDDRQLLEKRHSLCGRSCTTGASQVRQQVARHIWYPSVLDFEALQENSNGQRNVLQHSRREALVDKTIYRVGRHVCLRSCH